MFSCPHIPRGWAFPADWQCHDCVMDEQWAAFLRRVLGGQDERIPLDEADRP